MAQAKEKTKKSAKAEKNTLVIVESPAKAHTIEKYLGPGYTVKASTAPWWAQPSAPKAKPLTTQ